MPASPPDLIDRSQFPALFSPRPVDSNKGSFGSLGELIHDFRPFLDALPAPVARRVARDNFLAILPARGSADQR